MNKLSIKVKQDLIEYAFEMRLSNMFGDGLEENMIMYGCEIIGLNEMTDEELVNECVTYCCEEEEIIKQARAEIAIYNMLNN